MKTINNQNRPTVAVGKTTLEITNGPEAGRLIHIYVSPCLIGRGEQCQVTLKDPDEPPAISRHHATFEKSGGTLVVRDCSVNGTRVGHRWLRREEAAELHPGDELQLGPTLILCFQEAARYDAIPVSPRVASVASRPVGVPEGNLRAVLTSMETLSAAWRRVELNRGAAGPDNVTVRDFGIDANRRLEALRKLLERGQYQPTPPRLFAAPKRNGGVRKIAILSIQDRVVQQALHMVLQPILEPEFPRCSYAYRPGLSAHDALRHVDSLLRQSMTWAAETDIASFFDSISHTILMDQLATQVRDPFILSLVSRCIAACASSPGVGIAQGAGTSPLFSNLYLADFDSQMLDAHGNPVRYGDDLLLMTDSRIRAKSLLAEAEGYLRSRLHLALQPEKTRVTSLETGFTFLGYRFTAEGRKPSPQSIAQLHEKLEETPPAGSAAVIRGWENYFGQGNAGFPRASETGSASVSRAVPDQIDQGDRTDRIDRSGKSDFVSRFLQLFGGREDVFARQTAEKGRTCFTPCAGSITSDLVQEHLAGSETLAAFIMKVDGRVQTLVLDLDVARAAKSISDHPEQVEGPTTEFALNIMKVCRSFGIPASLEDSGRRGHHVWIFFSEPIPAEDARRLGRLITIKAGAPKEGVRIEIFPRHSEWPGPELGDAVKLPFGVHPLTGRRCFFLDKDGEPIVEVREAIESITPLKATAVEDVIRALATQGTQGTDGTDRTDRKKGKSDEISRLIGGCSVVRALVERAQATGHLRHTHQLILLYTAGRLGAEGAAFIHQTIANCRNYDPQICQGYIDRLETNHPPIGCRKIREWLEEEGESGLCTCPAGRRTPLELISSNEVAAAPKRRSRPAAQPVVVPTAEERAFWSEVLADMFAEGDQLD